MSNQQESPSHRRDGSSETIRYDWPALPIRASSLANIERVKIFRESFLGLLLQDPRVMARLDQWAQATGLMNAAQVMATAVDEQTVSDGMSAIESAMERLVMMSEDIALFLRDELHVPYAGLAMALLEELGDRAFIVMYGDGTPPTHTLRVEIDDPPAPNFRWSFRKRAGETESDIVARFVSEANAAYEQLIAACQVQGHVEIGRMRTNEVPTYAAWYYRHQVCKEPIRSIAQQHHKEKRHKKSFAMCDCRSTIRTGVKKAEDLINLAFPTS
jgi:hypothetical protein